MHRAEVRFPYNEPIFVYSVAYGITYSAKIVFGKKNDGQFLLLIELFLWTIMIFTGKLSHYQNREDGFCPLETASAIPLIPSLLPLLLTLYQRQHGNQRKVDNAIKCVPQLIDCVICPLNNSLIVGGCDISFEFNETHLFICQKHSIAYTAGNNTRSGNDSAIKWQQSNRIIVGIGCNETLRNELRCYISPICIAKITIIINVKILCGTLVESISHTNSATVL